MMPRSFLRSLFFALAILVIATSSAAAIQAPPQQEPAPVTTPPVRPQSTTNQGVEAHQVFDPVTVNQVASGLTYRHVKTLGISGEPYLPETSVTYLNRPGHLLLDPADNSLYVAEESGFRLLKYNANGVLQWKRGRAGMSSGGDDAFNGPKDIARAPDGNIWLADGGRIIEFTPAGERVQTVTEIEKDASGNGVDWIENAYGIAFDGQGHMFVSEEWAQRVLVFDWSSGSVPVYKKTATIGTKYESGNDETHLNRPIRLAATADGTLYILEQDNRQVRRCVYNDTNETWTCSAFLTGLNHPQGMAASPSGNLYITDEWEHKIIKCTGSTGDTCQDFNYDGWFWDIAIDGANNLYASDPWPCVVRKYNASGERVMDAFVGTENVCYQSDNQHFFQPRARLDPHGNLYVLEEGGQRLLKFSPTGAWLWTFGTAGHDIGDDANLNWPHGLDFGADGTIYIADSYRVLILNPDKSYKNKITAPDGDSFGWITDVAVNPVTKSLYVADHNRNRVMIFNPTTLAMVDQIGITDDCRTDNTGLCNPLGLAFDSAGYLYVAQENPNRTVKKYNSAKNVVLTLGVPEYGWSQEHGLFDTPDDVTVDAEGRIYVPDVWNNRIEIFNASGSYQATIGGSWGERHGEFRGAIQAAVASNGQVYVSDFQNARIEVFAPGFPGWIQKNLNGFGRRYEGGVSALEVYNGKLYAGTGNWNDGNGGSVWSSPDGRTWTQVAAPGAVANGRSPSFTDFQVFGSKLYATTAWGDTLAQLWRYDGAAWEKIMERDSAGFTTMTVFNNQIYVSDIGAPASEGTDPEGSSIWRSSTGNNNPADWERMAIGGNGNTNNNTISGYGVLGGSLYAAVANEADGMEIWRMATNGSSWSRIQTDGLGDTKTTEAGGFGLFNGELYLGGQNNAHGAKVWKTSNGSTWTEVTGDGFGDPDNIKIEALFPFNGRFYAVSKNANAGNQVWVTDDGSQWTRLTGGGFGDPVSDATLWNSANTVFQGSLYLGVWNGAKGGQIWQMAWPAYLPMVSKYTQATPTYGWVDVTSPTTQDLYSVKVTAGGGWAVGRGGTILRLSGNTWNTVTSPVTTDLNSVAIVSATDAWAVGDGGKILRWNGSAWSMVNSPTNADLQEISMLNATNGWAVGSSGVMMRWNGTSWNIYISPTNFDLFGVTMRSATDGWAVGGKFDPVNWYSDVILRWNGTTWSVFNHNNGLDQLEAVAFASDGQAWAVGGNNLYETWNGTTWTPVRFPTGTTLSWAYDLAVLSSSDVWVAGFKSSGDGQNILHWNGSAWSYVANPTTRSEALLGISFLSATDGWIVGSRGRILHYTQK